MKVSVDLTRCEAHGQCAMADASLFPLQEDGHSAVGEDRPVPPGKEDIAVVGTEMCPVAALRITHDG